MGSQRDIFLSTEYFFATLALLGFKWRLYFDDENVLHSINVSRYPHDVYVNVIDYRHSNNCGCVGEAEAQIFLGYFF